jgi:hypothetical protein
MQRWIGLGLLAATLTITGCAGSGGYGYRRNYHNDRYRYDRDYRNRSDSRYDRNYRDHRDRDHDRDNYDSRWR